MGQQTETERERGENEEKKERKKDVLMTCFEFLKCAATWNYYIYLSIYLFLAQFELDFANANKHVLTKIYAWYNRQISMLNSQNNIH